MLTAKSKTPKALVAAIRQAVKEGSHPTWEIDSKGRLSHTGGDDQWKALAYITLAADEAKDQMSCSCELSDVAILAAEKNPQYVYAVYMGRLAELLIGHFSDQFTALAMKAKKPPKSLLHYIKVNK